MKPLPTIGATRVLVTNGRGNLQIMDYAETKGGHNIMLSNWEPSPEDLAKLNAGGSIQLRIIGDRHPPVRLSVFPEGE